MATESKSFSSFRPRSYYILEPHSRWASDGEIPIEDVFERVYGRPWSSLEASAVDEVDGKLPNGALVEIDFSDETDGFYEDALEKFDSKKILIGRGFSGGPISKKGMTQMEYWLSIEPTTDRNAADFDHFSAMGKDISNSKLHSYDDIVRPGTHCLTMVVADLIRRGELPRARFLFNHWW